MDYAVQLIQAFLSFLSPILVVIVTIRMERTRKADARIKKLEEEKKNREEQELNDTIRSLQNSIDAVSKQLDETESTLASMREYDRIVQSSIEELKTSHKISTEFTQELAQLVTVLAEGMRDQHLDGNITRAISSYREFQEKKLTEYMSGSKTASSTTSQGDKT